MTTAPATTFAISGTLSASTARCRGVNRTIVRTPEIAAKRVPRRVPSISRRLWATGVRFCHLRAAGGWPFFTR
jgi:hypothetical protein